MMTPARASSQRTTYRAMACATMRAFANVKSSAITPRQPSVPNLIAVISRRGNYTRSDSFPNSRIGLLEEIPPALFFKPFHDFADVLGAITWADEQRVECIHDDQVVHTDYSSIFSGAGDQIAPGIERVAWSEEDVTVRGVLVEEQPMHRSPRADIAPAHFGGNHKDARSAFRSRSWLKDGVVHGDVFEFRVDDS